MKTMLRIFVILTVMLGCTRANFAELKKADLVRQAPLTQGGALLNQVDVLCLYFSSEKIAHAARPLQGKQVEIESTVLDSKLATNRNMLEEFVTRQIGTFVGVLMERLRMYAPEVAKKFDPKTDILFVVNRGPERQPVAVWKDGAWRWSEGGELLWAPAEKSQATSSVDLNQARTGTLPKKKSWYDCPAKRK